MNLFFLYTCMSNSALKVLCRIFSVLFFCSSTAIDIWDVGGILHLNTPLCPILYNSDNRLHVFFLIWGKGGQPMGVGLCTKCLLLVLLSPGCIMSPIHLLLPALPLALWKHGQPQFHFSCYASSALTIIIFF